ncbi:hypothetical protein J2766_001089 [Agrobacterium tumefaciens]|uniref:Phage major capsid protein n=1 Tax=Agrobacterium tumefaciens TaxID=358 RepID=A0AAW8LPU3_AGRTU|nr:hypothetical protein [Agrobacterium tumefaciens]MBP2564530.1 hypothetical protein [Agrobacterium tumefaciens]MDR6701605.1 hypothetical protein [Agrobacterium tumefaciens]
MGWNGSGAFNRNQDFTADRNAGPPDSIVASEKVDDEFNNYKGGLQNCLTRDGQNAPTANISWAGNKITNLGTPTSVSDAANKSYVDSLLTSTALGTTFTTFGVEAPATDDYLVFTDTSSSNALKRCTVETLLALASIKTANIESKAVTRAKMADGTANRILGYDNAGASVEISVDSGLTLASNVVKPTYATQAEAEAGTETSVFMNPLRVFQAIAKLTGFTKAPFVGEITTINLGSSFNSSSLAHGLGVVPKEVIAQVVCVNANNGYVAGDIVNLNTHQWFSSFDRGITVWADAANVGITYQTAVIFAKTTQGALSPSSPNWKLRLTAKV